jgi:hypothetical protein
MPIKAPPQKAPYPAPKFLQHVASSPEDWVKQHRSAAQNPMEFLQ